jgi:hypothetical protein
MGETAKLPALSRRTAITAGLAAGGAFLTAGPAFATGAVKHYILVDLAPGIDQLLLDRWYMTYHSQQVRRAVKAWQRNYISFRSYLPPPEATRRYSIGYGRMTEIQFDSFADFQETRPNNIYGKLDSYTPPPGGWASAETKFAHTTTATIPVNPQDLFVSRDTPPKEIAYLRWIIFFRYPKGVTEEAGDAWYRNVHAKELAKLPGLKRFGLYRTVTPAEPYPRVAELWFDDYPSWKKALLPPPSFTPPPWGGSFPFVDMISMFVGENPDVDFVNDKRSIP